MRNNNKGLSLVELIIVIGMFAIVGGMIVSFVAISTRTYKDVSAEVDVQEEAQLTLNQIKDLIIDTNRAISYGLEAPDDPTHTKEYTAVNETRTETSIISDWVAEGVNEDYIKRVLVIYSEKSTIETDVNGIETTTYTYPIIKIIYNQETSELFYAQEEFLDTDSIDISAFGTTESNMHLLSQYVTDFSIDLTNIENSQVDMELNFSSQSEKGKGQEYFSTPTINLRNKIIVSEILAEIYTGSEVEMNSFVMDVEILKDGNIITGDSIQLGSSIAYTAEVEAQYGASTGYTWSLTGDASGCVSTVTGSGIVTVPYDEPSAMLTLTATAVGDPTKKTSIPIVISGELRPTDVTVVVTQSVIGGTADDVRKTITFEATTCYTDGSKIIGEDITWTLPTNLPASSSYGYDNGKLILYLKADAGMTAYTVIASANELNIAGEVVSSGPITAVVKEDLSYTEPATMEVQLIPAIGTLSRGQYIDLEAQVSDYNGSVEDLKYEWEILESESGLSGTGTSSVSHVHLLDTDGNTNCLEIDKDLDWSTAFDIKIKVTAYDETDPGQTDSYTGTYTIPMVKLSIASTGTNVENWEFVQFMSWELENVVINRSDMSDMTYAYIKSAEGYQHWGDYHDVIFADSDILVNNQYCEYKTGKCNISRWANSGYITTIYYDLQLEYLGNTVTSSNTLMLTN